MFKFLKVFSNEPKSPEIETQRARFERVTAEMNEVLADLDVLPDVQFSAADKRIIVTAPDQFPDEALALPKPDAEPSAKTTGGDDAASADTSDVAPEPDRAPSDAEKSAA